MSQIKTEQFIKMIRTALEKVNAPLSTHVEIKAILDYAETQIDLENKKEIKNHPKKSTKN